VGTPDSALCGFWPLLSFFEQGDVEIVYQWKKTQNCHYPKERIMKQKYLLLILITLIAVPLGTAWAGPKVNPGSWEITTRTQIAGMPTQALKHVQCITADDLVPVSQDASQDCRVTDIAYKGNTVSWKISCGDESGGMTGTGSVTYSGNSMNGSMDMTVTGSGTMQVKNTFTGRRIGDCKGSSAGTTGDTGSAVGTAVANDVKDVGAAAKDEAKQSTVNTVRKGVRGLFDGLLD
jgi:hypothetical protein